MAITKFQRWKTSEKTSDDNSKLEQHLEVTPIYENEPLSIRMLYDKVHELTDLINSHITDMAANNAKVGITNSQASAITANTAKTGITTQQANTITANDKAVNDNATNITKNQNAITSLIAGKLEIIPNRTGSLKQTLKCGVIERLGVYNLNFVYEDVDRNGKTFTKTGSIQLK